MSGVTSSCFAPPFSRKVSWSWTSGNASFGSEGGTTKQAEGAAASSGPTHFSQTMHPIDRRSAVRLSFTMTCCWWMLAAVALTRPAVANWVLLDFEGLGDLELVENYYGTDTGAYQYGIVFKGAVASSSNIFIANEPSPPTAVDFDAAGAGYISIPNGFTGLSLQYVSWHPSVVFLYDGPDKTGSILAHYILSPTDEERNRLDGWRSVALPFPGVAKSVAFLTQHNVIFDDIRFNLVQVPVPRPTSKPKPPTKRVVLDFEGVGDHYPVDDYYGTYNGGPQYGIFFSGAAAIVHGGLDKSTDKEPSAPSVVTFNVASGGQSITIPKGVTGLSFQYVSKSTSTVAVYDGPDKSGSIIASATLPATDTDGGLFDVWRKFTLRFPGVARSVAFERARVYFDNIQVDMLAAPTQQPRKPPTGRPTKAPTKAPTAAPTKAPTMVPTMAPTEEPTKPPRKRSTKLPTKRPRKRPTKRPTTKPRRAPRRRPRQRPARA